MIAIASVRWPMIAHLRGRAAADHVSLSDTQNTRWWAVFDPDDFTAPIAIAGLIMTGGSAVRIKGIWVAPPHRKRGLGAALVHHLIGVAQHDCAPMIEALAYNPGFYVNELGFKPVGEPLRNGAQRVRRRL